MDEKRDEGSYVEIGSLADDYFEATGGTDGPFEHGIGIRVPMALLKELATEAPTGFAKILWDVSHESPKECLFAHVDHMSPLADGSLFLRWRVGFPEKPFPKEDEWVGIRFLNEKGFLVAKDLYLDAFDDPDSYSDWARALRYRGAKRLENVAEDWDPDFAEHKGDVEVAWPPLDQSRSYRDEYEENEKAAKAMILSGEAERLRQTLGAEASEPIGPNILMPHMVDERK